ncbi:A/G-specific adenine glycosylase [Flavobacteriaceae bacterium R38]|nr:A/G-specific adenine glycosylase [Flavobacteriaceae bacterium R38]
MNFNKTITNWYQKNKRDLPWRKTINPYYIWLSEIMLQQTRVEQGLPYYIKFTESYPTVFDLANAPEDEVLKLWQGLGYYSRARNLHATAKYVAFELNGVFPDAYAKLVKLKGVGDYTASAIASICFNEVTPVVDGNVYRVLARYFGIDTPINSTPGIKYFKQLAKELIDHDDPATYNQAIMEFGAKQCKPKSPNCAICPLNESCIALQKQKITQLPVKIKKGKIRKRYFNYLIVSDDDLVMLQQREQKGIWQNLYEFPLIEEPAELTKEEIVQHEYFKNLMEDNAYEVSLYNETPVIHKLSHQHIYTKFWIVNSHQKLKKGIELSSIRDYAVPVLIANFVEDYGF